MATQHTYQTGTYNGVKLHIITTAASNIKLLNLRAVASQQTLANSAYYGVNGAWFNSGTNQKILNIAMQDGSPVGPNSDEGTTNSIGTGAVAWNRFVVSAYTSVTNASSISVSGTASWIQGGIALWIGYHDWETKVIEQGSGASQYLAGKAGRTAMIGKLGYNEVSLFVTNDSVTFAEFRSAIQSFYGIVDSSQANNSHQGVMLDGGLSSQMKAKNSGNTTINIAKADSSGAYRPLTQLVTLRVTT